MGYIKATKIILWLVSLLLLGFSFYVYSQFYGTPWEKQQQEMNMEKYLEKKYHHDFAIKKTRYNFLSETYQAYAYPRKQSQLLFLVEQSPNSKEGYSDTYYKVK
ncbi:YfjL-like protein [Neobacillus bataviensis]|uniref:YfjL-like protein n=1 Tax=Neobacillus bataviensis TaxID=220685 RepID=UPI003F7DBEAF